MRSDTGSFEEVLNPLSGWIGLALWLALGVVDLIGAMSFISGPSFFTGAFCALVSVVLFWALGGFFILPPNTGIAFTFFGSYVGSVKEEGFWYTNPFYSGSRVSLRVSNHSCATIKVNDSHGSPIEIATVITWRVEDTRRAVFGVEDHEGFLNTQCEAALRQIASQHPYDSQHGDSGAESKELPSLRSDQNEIAELIRASVQSQCEPAGLAIVDARISHLAYAPEIAQMMLRRQQATAIVQARRTLVDGAVGMVESALKDLTDRKVATLDERAKAQLVINMMTVLLSDSGAQPVLNLSDNSK